MLRFCLALTAITFGITVGPGCDKSNAPASPPDAAASPAENVGAGDTTTAAPSEAAEVEGANAPDEGGGVDDAGDPSAAEDDTAEVVAATPSATDDPPPPEPTEPPAGAEKPAAEVLALPKPIFKDVKASCGKDGHVGTKLKPFKLQNTKGKALGNRSFGDRVLLVNFWGTWCKPCLKELPEFDRLQRKYRKHGLTVVAIATDEEVDPVQEIVDSKKLQAKVLLGGEDYAGKYGAPSFPFSFVVDPSGTIVGGYYNYKPECMGKLEDDIRTALEKRSTK